MNRLEIIHPLRWVASPGFRPYNRYLPPNPPLDFDIARPDTSTRDLNFFRESTQRLSSVTVNRGQTTMWYQIERHLEPFFRFCCSLSRQEWIVVFVGALIVGYFCMRGFGSRANY